MEQDADAAKRIHPNNRKRVIRAIEKSLYPENGEKYDFDRYSTEYDFKIFTLCCERAKLYERINKRVGQMMENGLEKEADMLKNRYGFDNVSMQAIGYKEFEPYFAGDSSREEPIEKIKRNTRRFAKRQLSWFKRDGRAKWIDIDGYDGIRQIAGMIAKSQEEGQTWI